MPVGGSSVVQNGCNANGCASAIATTLAVELFSFGSACGVRRWNRVLGKRLAPNAPATGLSGGGTFLFGGAASKSLVVGRRTQHACHGWGRDYCFGRMDFGHLSSKGTRREGSSRKSALFWAMLFLALASLVSLSIPPLRSPDEIDHIRRAYLLTRGTLILKTGASDVQGKAVQASGGEIDTGLDNFLMYHLGQLGKPDAGLAHTKESGVNQLRWSGQAAFRPAPGTSYYFPLLYAPQAAALVIGEQLKLTIIDSYNLARVFAIFACFALLGMAFLLHPVSLSALALLSLPMAMFQMASASLDGVSNALAVVCIAMFLRIHSKSTLTSRGQFGLWCFGLWALISCRPHLFPMLGLPFIVYFHARIRSQLASGICTLLATLAWFWIAVGATSDPRAQLGQSTSALMQTYVGHPGEFFVLLWQTLDSADNLKFYWQSFIGILGWLELPLPNWTYSFISATGVVLVLVASWAKPAPSVWKAQWSLTAVACASVLLVFFALLVTWTPHPATMINGVQGRYFFVPALMLAYAWQHPRHELGFWQQRISGLGLWSFIAFNSIVLTSTLQQRYPSTWAAGLLR